MADERWGEVPVAYVETDVDRVVTEQELIAHVKNRIARYKAPRRVLFEPLPKTSTGKVQKYALRQRLMSMTGSG